MEYFISPRNERSITLEDIRALYPEWEVKIIRKWKLWGSITKFRLALSNIRVAVSIISERDSWPYILRFAKNKFEGLTKEEFLVFGAAEFVVIVDINLENENSVAPLVSFWDGIVLKIPIH